ncbi:efflux pump antibiotic resistance protein [Cordyceps javanica]|uniref:Efflux pump antibiotic resistance protein n=1 Tax=Cordyceps javanica TaxID=43265 RepID=A0A545UTQ6_9HYPO|nr:efflux pump antibiotic resistance protein [Cordyceps javanica]TQW02163.1 efflux pump antibiotic resistance protein [Cordyceps javanica]
MAAVQDVSGGSTTISPVPVQDDGPSQIRQAYELAAVDQGTSSPGPAAAAPPEYPTGARLWLILVTVAAILVLACVDMNVLPTALPSITNHFHTVRDAGWYAAAFRLSVCAFQFVFGRAYALFSVRRVLVLANAVAVAGALLSGAAATSGALVLGRAVAGLGSSGLLAGCFAVLAQSLPLRRRPLVLGVMGGVEGAAACAAPLLGGALTQSVLGWRWCFYVTAPIGVATLACTWFCLPDAPKPEAVARLSVREKLARLDLLSNLIFLPSLTSLFLALSWAGTKYPWSDGRVVGTLVTFGVLFGAFIYNQARRGRSATLPPHIMKHRTVIAGMIFILCMNSADSILDYYLPTYYQVVRHYSPAKSGYMMLPIIVGAVVGSLIHGAGTSAFGYYAPFMLFASILGPVSLGLTTTFSGGTKFVQLIAYSFMFGLAYGIGFSGPQNAVQTTLAEEDIPLGLSVILFAQSLGPAVAVTVAQVLFSNKLSSSLARLNIGFNQTEMAERGLLEIFQIIPPESLDEALGGFEKSLSAAWYLAVAFACMTLVGTLLVEWKSVKTKKD